MSFCVWSIPSAERIPSSPCSAIAAAFQKNGGLVTAEDMAAYRAREIAPLVFHWGGCAIHTAPLAAGGLTVLQALGVLKALRWESLADGAAKTQAFVEVLRLAWADRLQLLGDPDPGTPRQARRGLHLEVPSRPDRLRHP